MRWKPWPGLFLMMLLAAGCAGRTSSGAVPTPSSSPAEVSPDIEVANASRPGTTFEFGPALVPGKITVFEYCSRHCEPSQKMTKAMRYLASRRADIAIRQLDIDRPEASGTDFDSPLATTHDIHAVPAFKIFNADGTLMAEGTAAKDQIRTWYNEAAQAETIEKAPSDVTRSYEGSGEPR